MARRALAGLEAYEAAPRPLRRGERTEVARVGAATFRDHGGDGPPLVLVPSLINPPDILDLDEEVSLARALRDFGFQVLLVDWGIAGARSALDVAAHVEKLLLPLLDAIGEPAVLVGYCLGGTMGIAAAQLAPVRGLMTLATPWHFARYPDEAQASLDRLWRQSQTASLRLGALPMEVLQAGFWALDPHRTVRKFAKFADLDPASDQSRRFVTLEDWANEGEPLPLPAARELFENLYRDDQPGRGRWRVAGKMISEHPPVPTLHLVAGEDRIVPPGSAPEGAQVRIASGHVGMIVGRARMQLHDALRHFLAS